MKKKTKKKICIVLFTGLFICSVLFFISNNVLGVQDDSDIEVTLHCELTTTSSEIASTLMPIGTYSFWDEPELDVVSFTHDSTRIEVTELQYSNTTTTSNLYDSLVIPANLSYYFNKSQITEYTVSAPKDTIISANINYNNTLREWNYLSVSYDSNDQDANIYDMYFDGTYWWLLGGEYGRVYKYDSNFNYLSQSYFVGDQDNIPYSITFDGTYWWVLGLQNDRVYKYDSNFNYLSVNKYIGTESLNPITITFDGTYFWMGGMTPSSSVHKYDVNWNYLSVSEYLGYYDSYIHDLFYDGIYWWMLGYTTDTVYKFDSTWNYITSYSVTAQDSAPDAIWFDNTYWWMTGNGNDKIYQYDANIHPIKSVSVNNFKYQVLGVNYTESFNMTHSSQCSYEYPERINVFCSFYFSSTALTNYDHISDLIILDQNISLTFYFWFSGSTFSFFGNISTGQNQWKVPTEVDLEINSQSIVDQTYNSGWVSLDTYPTSLIITASLNVYFKLNITVDFSFTFNLEIISKTYLKKSFELESDHEINIERMDFDSNLNILKIYLNNIDKGSSNPCTLYPPVNMDTGNIYTLEVILAEEIYLPLSYLYNTLGSGTSNIYLSGISNTLTYSNINGNHLYSIILPTNWNPEYADLTFSNIDYFPDYTPNYTNDLSGYGYTTPSYSDEDVSWGAQYYQTNANGSKLGESGGSGYENVYSEYFNMLNGYMYHTYGDLDGYNSTYTVLDYLFMQNMFPTELNFEDWTSWVHDYNSEYISSSYDNTTVNLNSYLNTGSDSSVPLNSSFVMINGTHSNNGSLWTIDGDYHTFQCEFTGLSGMVDVFLDDFNDASRDGYWTDDANSGTITEADNVLKFTADSSCNWDPPTYNAPKSYVSTSIYTQTDWGVEVYIASPLGSIPAKHQYGLCIYEDDDNVWLFGHDDDAGDKIQIQKIVSGSTSVVTSVSSTDPYIRIQKINNYFYFDYSSDGSSWINLHNTNSLETDDDNVGLYHKCWGTGVEETIHFDNFRMYENRTGSDTVVNFTSQIIFTQTGKQANDTIDYIRLYYSHKTNDSEQIDFYVWNWDLNQWDLVNSSTNNVNFYNLYFTLNSSHYDGSNTVKLKWFGNGTSNYELDIDKLLIQVNWTKTSGLIYATISKDIDFSFLNWYDAYSDYLKLYNVTISFLYRYTNYTGYTQVAEFYYDGNTYTLTKDGSWHSISLNFEFDSIITSNFSILFNITNGLLELNTNFNYTIFFKCMIPSYLYEGFPDNFNDESIGTSGTSINWVDYAYVSLDYCNNLANWSDVIEDSGSTFTVIESWQSRNNVIQISDGIVGYACGWQVFDTTHVSGSIYLYIGSTNVSGNTYFYLNDGGVYPAGVGFVADNLCYYDGAWNIIIGATDNVWYKVRIDFECGDGAYKGLDPDTYKIWIDNVEYGPYNFASGRTSFNKVFFRTISGTIKNSYLDGLYYSWDVDPVKQSIIESSWQNHRNILKLTHGIDVNDPYIIHNMIPATSGIVEFYWGGTDTSEECLLQLREYNTIIINLKINDDNLYYESSAPVWVDIGDVTDNTLYHFKIIWRADNTFDVYLDGILVVNNQITRNNQENGIDDCYIIINDNNGCSYYIDAWGEVNDPDYDEGDNFGQRGIITEIYQFFRYIPSFSLDYLQQTRGNWILNFTYTFNASSDLGLYTFYNTIDYSLLYFMVYVNTENGWEDPVIYNYNTTQNNIDFTFNITEYIISQGALEFNDFYLEVYLSGNPSEFELDNLTLFDFDSDFYQVQALWISDTFMISHQNFTVYWKASDRYIDRVEIEELYDSAITTIYNITLLNNTLQFQTWFNCSFGFYELNFTFYDNYSNWEKWTLNFTLISSISISTAYKNPIFINEINTISSYIITDYSLIGVWYGNSTDYVLQYDNSSYPLYDYEFNFTYSSSIETTYAISVKVLSEYNDIFWCNITLLSVIERTTLLDINNLHYSYYQDEQMNITFVLRDLYNIPISNKLLNFTIEDPDGSMIVNSSGITNINGNYNYTLSFNISYEIGFYHLNCSFSGDNNFTGVWKLQSFQVRPILREVNSTDINLQVNGNPVIDNYIQINWTNNLTLSNLNTATFDMSIILKLNYTASIAYSQQLSYSYTFSATSYINSLLFDCANITDYPSNFTAYYYDNSRSSNYALIGDTFQVLDLVGDTLYNLNSFSFLFTYIDTSQIQRVQLTENPRTDINTVQFKESLTANRTFSYWYFHNSLNISTVSLYHNCTGTTVSYTDFTIERSNYYFKKSCLDGDMFTATTTYWIDWEDYMSYEIITKNGTYCEVKVTYQGPFNIQNVTIVLDLNADNLYAENWSMDGTQSLYTFKLEIPNINFTTTQRSFTITGRSSIPYCSFSYFENEDDYDFDEDDYNDDDNWGWYRGYLTFPYYSQAFIIQGRNTTWTLDGVHYSGDEYDITDTGYFECSGFGTGISSAYLRFKAHPIGKVERYVNYRQDYTEIIYRINTILEVQDAAFEFYIENDEAYTIIDIFFEGDEVDHDEYRQVKLTKKDGKDYYLLLNLDFERGVNKIHIQYREEKLENNAGQLLLILIAFIFLGICIWRFYVIFKIGKKQKLKRMDLIYLFFFMPHRISDEKVKKRVKQNEKKGKPRQRTWDELKKSAEVLKRKKTKEKEKKKEIKKKRG